MNKALLPGLRLPLLLALVGFSLGGVRPSRQTSGAAPSVSARAQPSVDQILDKYIQACGGRAAIASLTSRTSKGRRQYTDGGVESFQISLKAPNKWVAIYKTARGEERYGFDGSKGWYDAPWPDISKLPREVDLYTPLRLKEWYPGMVFIGTASVDKRAVYVTEGSWQNRPPDRYYFDAESGLLVRQDERARAAVSKGSDAASAGAAGKVIEYYYDDYRKVKNVKLPFVIRRKDGRGLQTEIFHEIRHNVVIPDSKFRR